MTMGKNVVILENIRSAYNVGAMFRTADGAGISKIYLVGYTPAPIDKFKRPQKEIAKTALGAEFSVPWEQVDDMKKLLNSLKNAGYTTIALEQHGSSELVTEISNYTPFALVVGSEVDGVKEATLKLVDKILEIPMYGEKNSLNVASAFAVAVYCSALGRDHL